MTIEISSFDSAFDNFNVLFNPQFDVLADIPRDLQSTIIDSFSLIIHPEVIVNEVGDIVAIELLSRSVGVNDMEPLFYSMSDADLCEVTIWQLEVASALLKSQPKVKVSINLSIRIMRNPKLIAALFSMDKCEINNIALEVVIEDFSENILNVILLDDLKGVGYEIWLDDYCPTLDWALYSYKWDVVKIDRMYVWSIDVNLLDLMREINSFRIVVEGIETTLLYDTYKKICFGMQGYLFAESKVK